MQPLSVGYRARLAFDRARSSRRRTASAAARARPAGPRLRSCASGSRPGSQTEGCRETSDGSRPDPGGRLAPLGAPLVAARGAPDAARAPTTSRSCARRPSTTSSTSACRPARRDALLYRLLRHSVLLAQARHRATASSSAAALLPDAPYREPALVDIARRDRSARAHADADARARPRSRAARRDPHASARRRSPRPRTSTSCARASRTCETLPADALGTPPRGRLDLFAYRLDAWITSLATRRLDELRRQSARAARARRLRLGAEPRARAAHAGRRAAAGESGAPLFAARERGGAIHAPSMAQAVGRGRAAQRLPRRQRARTGRSPFAIDLRSERVRAGAVRCSTACARASRSARCSATASSAACTSAGSTASSPGFRRSSLLAASTTRGDRRRAPCRRRTAGLPAALTAVAGSATDFDARRGARRSGERYGWPATADAGAPGARPSVADGLALARSSTGGACRSSGSACAGRIAPATARAARRRSSLRALDEAVDALGDALTAEGVFQLVRGNPARAAASVDASRTARSSRRSSSSRETPRPARRSPTGWSSLLSGRAAAPAAGAGRAARAAPAEPALDALAARRCSATRATCASRAEFVDGAGSVLLRRDDLRLSRARSPRRPGRALPRRGGAAGVAVRPRAAARARAPARGAGDDPPTARGCACSASAPPGCRATVLALGEFLELLRAFREVILRRARARRRATSPTPAATRRPRSTRAELRARADAATQALRRARHGRCGAHPTTSASALVDLAFLGFPDAVPLAPRGGDALDAQATATVAEAGRGAARRLVDAGGRLRPRRREPGGARAARPGAAAGRLRRRVPCAAARAPGQRRRARQLRCGARTSCRAATRCRRSPGCRARPACAPARRGWTARSTYAAALGRAPALALQVAQLPFVAGERWVGAAPVAGGALPRRQALARRAPAAAVPSRRSRSPGSWSTSGSRSCPRAEVTTGVAFNYERPGARPPQSILLAVAPPARRAGRSRRSSRRCSRRSSSPSCARSTRRRSASRRPGRDSQTTSCFSAAAGALRERQPRRRDRVDRLHEG